MKYHQAAEFIHWFFSRNIFKCLGCITHGGRCQEYKKTILTTINWIPTLCQVLLYTLSNTIFTMILHGKWYYQQVLFYFHSLNFT